MHTKLRTHAHAHTHTEDCTHMMPTTKDYAVKYSVIFQVHSMFWCLKFCSSDVFQCQEIEHGDEFFVVHKKGGESVSKWRLSLYVGLWWEGRAWVSEDFHCSVAHLPLCCKQIISNTQQGITISEEVLAGLELVFFRVGQDIILGRCLTG